MIIHLPEYLGGIPDALTQRSEDLHSERGDERLTQQEKALLKPKNLDSTCLNPSLTTLAKIETTLALIRKGYTYDPDPQKLKDTVKRQD